MNLRLYRLKYYTVIQLHGISLEPELYKVTDMFMVLTTSNVKAMTLLQLTLFVIELKYL